LSMMSASVQTLQPLVPIDFKQFQVCL